MRHGDVLTAVTMIDDPVFLTERLVRMEGHADDIHAAGLKAAFQTHRDGNAIAFVVQREIFKHLERIVDAFEDVANVIDGIVIDHS